MNDELQKALAEFIRGAVETTSREIPATLQEVVRWGAISAAVWAVATACLTAALVYMARRCFTKALQADEECDDSGGWWILMVVSATSALIASLTTVENVLTAVQALVTPRAYLLDYVRQMVQ